MPVDEWAIMKEVSGGIRKPGIRIGKEKYTFIKFDQEYRSAHLIRQNGGAVVCKTAKCVIIGMWDKGCQMSNGAGQNSSDACIEVENMAEYLRKQGF